MRLPRVDEIRDLQTQVPLRYPNCASDDARFAAGEGQEVVREGAVDDLEGLVYQGQLGDPLHHGALVVLAHARGADLGASRQAGP